MTNLFKITLLALMGLLITHPCAASPIREVPADSIDGSPNGGLIKRPKLLGENNIPTPKHVVQAYDYYKSQGDKLDEPYRNLLGLGGTSFWAILHAFALSKDGYWVTDMLSIPEGGDVEHTVSVETCQYAEGAFKKVDQKVVAADADIPTWPLVIADAVLKAGWRPQSPEANADDDAEKLLELMSCRQVNTNFHVDSADAIWEAAKLAKDYAAFIYLESIGWILVTEVTDASIQEFRISLFPFLDRDNALGLFPITATDYFAKYGSVTKKTVFWA